MRFILALALTIGTSLVSASDLIRVTVFDLERPNEVLATKEFQIQDYKHSHYLGLMQNRTTPVVESYRGENRCTTQTSSFGLEMYLRSKQASDFRHDITLTFMEAKPVNIRMENGIAGCEMIEVFDIEKNAWTKEFGIIEGFPKVLVLQNQYKVVIGIH